VRSETSNGRRRGERGETPLIGDLHRQISLEETNQPSLLFARRESDCFRSGAELKAYTNARGSARAPSNSFESSGQYVNLPLETLGSRADFAFANRASDNPFKQRANQETLSHE